MIKELPCTHCGQDLHIPARYNAENIAQLEADNERLNKTLDEIDKASKRLEIKVNNMEIKASRLREFYDAHCAMENATVDWTLHKAHVERLRLARIALEGGE